MRCSAKISAPVLHFSGLQQHKRCFLLQHRQRYVLVYISKLGRLSPCLVGTFSQGAGPASGRPAAGLYETPAHAGFWHLSTGVGKKSVCLALKRTQFDRVARDSHSCQFLALWHHRVEHQTAPKKGGQKTEVVRMPGYRHGQIACQAFCMPCKLKELHGLLLFCPRPINTKTACGLLAQNCT